MVNNQKQRKKLLSDFYKLDGIALSPKESFNEKTKLTTVEELTKNILEEANNRVSKKSTGTTKYELTPKALEMAKTMANNPGVQNMIKNPIMGSSISTNSDTEQPNEIKQKKEQIESEQQTTTPKQKKKNPDYTTISAGAIKPLRTRDSIADILGKMYNLMIFDWENKKKNDKKETKYKKQLIKNKEKNIEELISLFGGKYTKKEYKEPKKGSSLFGKILSYGVLGAGLLLMSKKSLANFMPAIPDFVKDFLGFQTESLPTGPATSVSELISRGESGGSYDIYNTGEAGATGTPLKLSEMSVGEVMDLQDKKKVFAAGKYQVIPETLKEAVSKLSINKSDKFSPELQERIFTEYLIGSKPGRGAISKYLNSPTVPDEKTKHAALKQLSQEFAAVADPDTGKSFYAGKGNNAASISSVEMLAALESDRQSRQSNLAKTNKEIPAVSSTKSVNETPTTSPISPKNIDIPDVISYNEPMNMGASVAILNNTTNVINGGTTYAINEEKETNHSPFIEKQYYG